MEELLNLNCCASGFFLCGVCVAFASMGWTEEPVAILVFRV